MGLIVFHKVGDEPEIVRLRRLRGIEERGHDHDLVSASALEALGEAALQVARERVRPEPW
jgi:hypothetical protein